MVHQDFRKNAMQAYIKYKTYYDKKGQRFKTQRSRLCIRLTAGRRSSRDQSSFYRISVLPNNNYLVRRMGTNKTKVLHGMRMCQFTPRQTPADIRKTPQEWKPDPGVSLKHDDLYARAWECD